jgi:hypothetical protein
MGITVVIVLQGSGEFRRLPLSSPPHKRTGSGRDVMSHSPARKRRAIQTNGVHEVHETFLIQLSR